MKLELKLFPRAARDELVRTYTARLETQRRKLEDLKCEQHQSDVLRGRIAEIREILRTFETTLPVTTWSEHDD